MKIIIVKRAETDGRGWKRKSEDPRQSSEHFTHKYPLHISLTFSDEKTANVRVVHVVKGFPRSREMEIS